MSRERSRVGVLSGALLLVGLLVLGAGPTPGEAKDRRKVVLGPIESVTVKGCKAAFRARIDTGAATCSIHCESMEIESPHPDPRKNVGKLLTFVTRDARGRKSKLRGKIVKTTLVRGSEGADRRYKVRLTLSCKGVSREVDVNLNDRRKMTYKLLIGRNFLRGAFLVDVSLETDH